MSDVACLYCEGPAKMTATGRFPGHAYEQFHCVTCNRSWSIRSCSCTSACPWRGVS